MTINPSASEQEMLQLVNLFRTDPRGEYARLITSTNPRQGVNPQITNAINFFNVDMSRLQTALNALTPTAPVVWNEKLIGTALAHNQVMLQVDQQTHQAPGEPRLGDRVRAAGYSFLLVGENIFAFTQNVVEGHASLVIDWGNGPGGMQEPAGHRITYMNPEYTEVGISILADPNTTNKVGPLLVTQDFGKPATPLPPMSVGAVFRDLDKDGLYDAGDGLGGVEVTFTGPMGTFRTTTMSAGGYQLELPVGTYTAVARGGGLAGTVVRNNVVSTGKNVFVNFIEGRSDAIAADAMEPNEDFGSAKTLGGGDQTISNLNLHRTGDKDFFKFVPNASGPAVIDALFSQSQGDIDLQFYDSGQRLLAQSAGRTDNERINVSVVRGQTYYVAAVGFQDSLSLGYSLKLDLPEVPPPPAADAEEPNESGTVARELGPQDVRLTNLTLSSASDHDWFRFTPQSSGTLAVDALFSQLAGDVDLDIRNAGGSLLGESKGTSDNERVSITVQAGVAYFIHVFGKSGDTSTGYTLNVDGPGVVPPTAASDIAQLNAGSSLEIDVLANDRSAGDRPVVQPTIELESAGGTNAPLWEVVNNRIRVTAAANLHGIYSNRYRVKDVSGQFSPFTTIQLMVIVPGVNAFQNQSRPNDVDGNNAVEPIDALLIINLLNQDRFTNLPQQATSGGPQSFVDVNGNGMLEPIDALLVINQLNANVVGSVQIVPLISREPDDPFQREEF